jgi:dTDP-4-dehydrorhamnose 3,5-epimerase-like enzyme
MIIEGNNFIDDRGLIQFFNVFDMSEIKRFYTIFHPNTSIVRAWQGNRIETRWFYCTQGAFDIRLVKIDDWESPSDNLNVEKLILNSESPLILKVASGYVNGIKAISNNSKLISFSNFRFNENQNNHFRFDKNKWTNWEE